MSLSVFLELRCWLLVGLSLVLPVVFGGIGVNLISHVLLRHLTEAEGRFDREHSDR